MRILLLCQGTPVAKDMLRKAIERRYGMNPPVIEKLHIGFKGRAKAPDGEWMPLSAQARFELPNKVRWDFVANDTRHDMQQGAIAYDGFSYRHTRDDANLEKITQTDYLNSMRSQLWSLATMLLTPLSDHMVKLTECGDFCLEAKNTQLNESTTIRLRDDYSVKSVEVPCWNPRTQRQQLYRLVMTRETAPVDGFILPKRLGAFWDKDPDYEMMPVRVERHPEFPPEIFNLGGVGTN